MRPLYPSVVAILGSLGLGCAESAPPPAQAPSTTEGFTTNETATKDRWGTFHSRRFNLVLRLPGGSEWRVDDRSRPELVAIHSASRSRLAAARWTATSLQNRESCLATARERGLAPPASARIVDDSAEVRPSGEDVRSWASIEPGASDAAPVRGYATLVSAQIKKCLVVSYVTEVPSMKDEAELTTRLAVIREGTLARARVEAFDEVPRERPR